MEFSDFWVFPLNYNKKQERFKTLKFIEILFMKSYEILVVNKIYFKTTVKNSYFYVLGKMWKYWFRTTYKTKLKLQNLFLLKNNQK